MQNHKLILKSRPEKYAGPKNFELVEENSAPLKSGQVKVQVEMISLDPAMRGWMDDSDSYIPPVELGSVMRAFAAGHVEKSESKKFSEGDAVVGLFGTQEHAIVNDSEIHKVNTDLAPLERWVGGLGMPGLTAYFGMETIAKINEGETIVVSAASGAVGQVVGQIAKIKGARTIGIAGGEQKCKLLTEQFGYDESLDYKKSNFTEKLSQLCPEGVDVYWESVGGPVGNAVISKMARNGRVVLCGMIANYNEPGETGLTLEAYGNLLKNRVLLQGLIVLDFMDKPEDALNQLAKWHKEGKIKFLEDVRETRLEQFPEILNELYTGSNQGKLVMKIH